MEKNIDIIVFIEYNVIITDNIMLKVIQNDNKVNK
jgi:hypothetical protein